MKSKSNRIKSTIKRGICIMLILVLIIPTFIMPISASEPDSDDDNKGFFDGLLEGIKGIFGQGGEFYEGFKQGIHDSLYGVAGDKSEPDTIKIGEYVFEKYNFDTTFSLDEMEYNDQRKTIYMPFFIYKDDLYFIGKNLMNVTNYTSLLGYQFFNKMIIGDNEQYSFYFMDLSGAMFLKRIYYGTVIDDYNFYISPEENFSTSITIFDKIDVDDTKKYPTQADVNNGEHLKRHLFNASQYARNNQPGAIPQEYIKTVEKITAGDTPEFIQSNIYNFSPEDLGTGVFKVPASFETEAGMTFFDYLGTLTPDSNGKIFSTSKGTDGGLQGFLNGLLGGFGGIFIDFEATLKGFLDGFAFTMLGTVGDFETNLKGFLDGFEFGLSGAFGDFESFLKGFLDGFAFTMLGTVGDFETNLKGFLDGFEFGLSGILDGFGSGLGDGFKKSILGIHGEEFSVVFERKIKEKMPVIFQIEELFENLIEVLSNPPQKAPAIEIKGNFMGMKLEGNLLDITPFVGYLPILHGIIIGFAYIGFALSLLKRIPKLLGGI